MTHSSAETDEKTLFGFWVYLLTDFMLFITLFAAYAVLHKNTHGGAGIKDLFTLDQVFVWSGVFLASCLPMGWASVAAYRQQRGGALLGLVLTFGIGVFFLMMECGHFGQMIAAGYDWKQSGFLSALYTVVGMHTLHVIFALLWIVVLGVPLLLEGTTSTVVRRIACLKMFWLFLNIIWVCIFTLVFVMGMV